MTSIHMETQPQVVPSTNGVAGTPNIVGINQNQQQQSLSTSQNSSKYDEHERVRQRMANLRQHHNDSTEIYNDTQPKINEQIHEETMKYLKSGQINGTKTKSQKPRAPKKPRNTANNNSNNIPNVAPIITNNSTANTQPATTTANGFPPQAQHIRSQGPIQQQGHPVQQISLYPPRNQQPIDTRPQHPNQMQQHQQPPQFKYQTSNNTIFPKQMSHQPAQHQYQTQRMPVSQQQHMYPHQNQTHQQQHFAQQMNPHQHPQHSIHHHHMPQSMPTQNNIHAQHSLHMQHQQIQIPISSLPNDLDLPIQGGLECDVDSLIKHEMSVEGQLDFNPELLFKLDNQYQPQQPNQHQHNYSMQQMH